MYCPAAVLAALVSPAAGFGHDVTFAAVLFAASAPQDSDEWALHINNLLNVLIIEQASSTPALALVVSCPLFYHIGSGGVRPVCGLAWLLLVSRWHTMPTADYT